MPSLLSPRARFWLGWGVACGVLAVVLGLAVAPPWLPEAWRPALMGAFAPSCHQLPTRSPHLLGVQLAVCDRCLGIYAGMMLGAVAYLGLRQWDAALHRGAGVVFVVALAPLAADWALPWLGRMLAWMDVAHGPLVTNVPWSRALTGGVFGLAAGYFVARTGVEALRPSSTAETNAPEAEAVEAE